MLKLKSAKRYLLPGFLVSELVLAVLVQVTGGALCRAVSFAAVVLAAIFVALYAHGSAEYVATQFALIFTVLADLFLVVLDQTYATRVVAMCFFFATQICYSTRILYTTPHEPHRKAQVGARNVISVAAALVTVLVLGSGADALAIISVVYYANLILNVVLSAVALRPAIKSAHDGGVISTSDASAEEKMLEFSTAAYKRRVLLFVGLLLFLICDFFIGMACLGEYLPLSEGTLVFALANPPFNVAWIFYVPSQTLLAISLED